MTGCIYTLSCPLTNLVKYVGQTVNVNKRYNLHLYHSKNGKARTHKEKWINSLMNQSLKPVIEIIWQGEISMLDKKEIEFIALFKACGAKLTNQTLGGLTTRGYKFPEEVKRKLSERSKGKCLRPPITEAEKTAISLRQSNFKHTLQSKLKLSIARKGKPSYWSINEMPTHLKQRICAIGKERSKQIIAIKNGVEVRFASTSEAEKITGCDRKTMRLVANGIYKQCKGYIFKWGALESNTQ